MTTSIENSENKLCDYGCGQIARFQFGNGKLCCSDNQGKCKFIINKISKKITGLKKEKSISIENPENKLCDYGCGQIAKFKSKNGKICCSKSSTECPVIKTKVRDWNIGRKMESYQEIENSENKLCDYGCGQIARFKLKSGRYCCSDNAKRCQSERDKASRSLKNKKKPEYEKIENPENKLCDYGCGQIAKYQFGNGRYCCSDNFRRCENERNKLKTRKILKYKPIENPENKLCDYGCGQIAKFKFRNGKICCSNESYKCSNFFENKSVTIYEEPSLFENKLCDYGCGHPAKFKFKHGKYCCSDNFKKCPVEKEKNSVLRIGMIYSARTEYKPIVNPENNLCDYGCGQIAKYQFGNGKYCCQDYPGKCVGHVGKKMDYKLFKNKYPDIFLVENLIEGPNGEVLGHCKNASCNKSEENGEYFEVTYQQIYNRNLGINSISDSDYFYCCEECKKSCILFGRSANTLNNIISPKGNLNQASTQDLSIWRNEVFTMQLKDNSTRLENFCEICHKTENLIGHHILPQKLYPEFALDPDNGIVLCSECHTKYGHTKGTECSTANLANKICE
jgi:hypothetical protein